MARINRHRIKSSDLVASIPGGNPSELSPSWQLVPLLAGTELPLEPFEISEAEKVLGSGPKADIKVLGTASEHVCFELTATGLVVTDLGSSAGTSVAGKQIAAGQSVTVQSGDHIKIGGLNFIARSTAGGNPVTTASFDSVQASESQQLLTHAGRGSASASEGAQVSRTVESTIVQYGHWLLTLGLMYWANRALASATAAAGIAFPSPLIGMFIIIGVLTALSAFSQDAAENLTAFFGPALDWITRWLPLFYVPSLVVVPLSVSGLGGSELAKILAVIAVGMPASLLVTAAVAKNIRRLVNTELEPPPPTKASAPFTRLHHASWSAIAVVSLAAAYWGPLDWKLKASIPFLLAATIEGYLIGDALPSSVSKLFHPLITCAVVANLAAYLYGELIGGGYRNALRIYLTKGVGGVMGAGDILMSFLGVVILSFGFRIFGQRRLMVRHAPEIFGSTTISAAFSLFATGAASRAIGLSPDIARALAPRSVTIALALPIAAQLNAPASITAAGVVFTGLLGANFVQLLLNKMGYNDPIARGLATAGASHGLGTAALAGKEPEALPFCALAYALIGIISTVLASIPIVRSALLAVTA